MSTSNAPHADRTEPDEVEGTSDDADDADADDAVSDVEGSSLPGLKPSTKGVMLGLREWHKFKATMGAIEDALEETKEKRRAARR